MSEDFQYDEKAFADRLAHLRMNMGVSAREMSLAIGQNPAYINNIETCKAFPSMMGFFYICDYLHITPVEFFDTGNPNPDQVNRIAEYLKKLNSDQLDHFEGLSRDLAEAKGKRKK